MTAVTRRDITINWIAYLVGLAIVTIFNYNILGWLPISLPLLMPMAAVAVGIYTLIGRVVRKEASTTVFVRDFSSLIHRAFVSE